MSNGHNFESRCIGATMGCFVGDALGAGVEGQSHAAIMKQFPSGIRKLFSATHMGVYHLPPRIGCYTDDTNSALAIMSSLVDLNGTLNQHHVAYRHARHWFDGMSLPVFRGYPDSAQKMMRATIEGKLSAHECATLAFKDGSYANGAAMKAFPIGLAFRKVFEKDPGAFNDALKASCAYSHVHPLGVDAGIVQAHAVRLACDLEAPIDPSKFLQELQSICTTDDIRSKLVKLEAAVAGWPPKSAASTFVDEATLLFNTAKGIVGDAMGFQIDGPSAIVCSLVPFLRYQDNVMEVIAHSIALGGDTDTIAAMAGACSGALKGGTDWIPAEIFDGLENGDRGRDWTLQLAKTIAQLVETDQIRIDRTGAPPPRTAADRAWERCNTYFQHFKQKHTTAIPNVDLPAFDQLLVDVWKNDLTAGDENASVSKEDIAALLPAVTGNRGTKQRTAAEERLAALPSSLNCDQFTKLVLDSFTS